MMRLFVAVLMVGLMLASGSAEAAWEQYIYEDFGFGVDFPAEPGVESGTYQAAVAGERETTIFEVEDGGIVYRATVVDISDQLIDAASILEEAVFIWGRAGELTVDRIARPGPWETAVYGRRLTKELEDGGRATASLFVTKGRLYIFESVVPGGGDIESPAPGRFVQTVIFNIDWDWSVWPPVPR